MDLVRRVEVAGFRSLLDVEFPEFGGLTTLVGRNSSGKSNVLRALNLFFNNQIEPGKAISFLRDYHEQRARRKKKRIVIAVEFEIPSNFKYRAQLKHLVALGDRFRIERVWELDPQRRPIDKVTVSSEGAPVANGAELARQFLGLVSYRYIPNRSIPADLLRDESQALADSIFMRMKGDQHAAALMQGLDAAAGRLLSDAQRSMRTAGSPLETPTVATPATLGEMLSMTGFQATGPHGGLVQDEDWGAGHQAFFLYLVLHALDTNYGRFFGWRQAVVWGVEEPESGLHRDLESRLAERFRAWTNDARSKLQILQTTHSPILTMAADLGYWVALEGPETTVSKMDIPELARAAESRGVSGWVHPVLSFPWNPVVLVEGRSDAEALSHVAVILGFGHLRFLSLPELDTTVPSGGKDAIIQYLRRNCRLIHNRPREAPLLVALDWDVSNQDLERARKAYGDGGARRVLRMDASYCDDLMGKDFRGIERFFPPALALAAHEAEECILGVRPGRPYSISKTQLDGAKHHLQRRLRQVDELSQLHPLAKVLEGLQASVLADKPVQMKLLPDG